MFVVFFILFCVFKILCLFCRRKRLIGEASPIRIFFDLRYINDDRSCRSIGQETIDHVGQKYICRSEDVLTDVKFALLYE